MKVLTLQDISCYGQCSITVALPILSAFGQETIILPSAILSTHTSGFKNFTVHDLTNEIPRIINHWEQEKISFDAIYTGYIGDARQFDYVLELKDKMLSKNGILFVDPAMADDGQMYCGLKEDIVEGMRKICSIADYIIPNITEACFLTNTEYQEKQDETFINTLLERLLALGCKNVILSGYQKGNEIGAIFYNKDGRIDVLKEKIHPSYHGTGDVFSSVILANILNDKPMKDVLDYATDFVVDAIKETKDDAKHNYGVKFEKVLYKGLKK